MATVLNQAVGAILANYADVIEGGNSYRGSGTAHRGIPGTRPYDDGLATGADTPLDVVGDSVSTTTFDVAATYDWPSSRWVPEAGPAFWAMQNTGSSAAYEEARKVSGWNNATKLFTVSAFSAAPAAADSMVMLQGFKRIPNQTDIGVFTNGFDRYFHLRMSPGADEDRSGRGVRTKRTKLDLRMRFLKRGREHDAVVSAFENLAIVTAALESSHSPDHRDGTYTRALWAAEPPTEETNDDVKIIVMQRFEIIYQIAAVLK